MRYLAVMLLLASTGTYSYARQLPSIELSLKEPYAHRLENAQAKLYKGKYLDNVIRLLESCAKEKPGEIDVHLDLACANAGKAHVLAKAQIERLQYPSRMERYQTDLLNWTQAQKDPKEILFETSAPVKPEAPKTIDDNLVLSKPDEVVKESIAKYAASALKELSKAEALLEKSEDAEAKRDFLSVEAWVKAILWRYPRMMAKDCLPAGMKAEDVFARFEDLCKKSPNDKEALLVLSDLYGYVGKYNDFRAFNHAAYRLNLPYPRRPEFLERSLLLLEEYVKKSRKKEALLALRVSTLRQDQRYLVIQNMDISERTRERIETDQALGLEPLQAYVTQNPNNSTMWYLLAMKLLLNGKLEPTWNAILRGNETTPGGFPEYRMHVPKALAWAIPVQVIVPDTGTLIGEAVSSKIRFSTSPQEKLDAITHGVVCVEHLEKAESLPGVSPENKALLLHARQMVTSSLTIYLAYLIEEHKNLKVPSSVVAFMDRNKYAQHRARETREYFRKLAGESK